MSTKSKICILVGTIILIISVVLIWNKHNSNNQQILNKIDSLNTINNRQIIIRDSLHNVLDTNTIIIKEIHKTYEKNINTILHQSNAADWKFLTDYLSRYTIDSTGLKKVESDSSSTQQMGK